MPLDQSFVGRVYPPTATYEVSRAKIKEFADAVGDANPLYRDPEAARAAGFPDVIAPPTFLTVVNLEAINAIVSDPELGLDYGRMVHGDQSFAYERPVHAGDVLAVTTTVAEIMNRAGNDFITMRGDVRDADDALVVTVQAQLVVRGAE
ncbi:MaoC family dehydratase N-terminal domain-containing protein [Labedaea rhizosphaerae]|uniref:MaoC family dehydratase N-terminal domain-containing protein n=1 Tax=Labedaea rhizosphaerae TaxID=598644 RepID=UPI00105E181E|nr:MaoC family dehydratase N-terminal domain-containing protein [Labedaea rhizosphaerae]